MMRATEPENSDTNRAKIRTNVSQETNNNEKLTNYKNINKRRRKKTLPRKTDEAPVNEVGGGKESVEGAKSEVNKLA